MSKTKAIKFFGKDIFPDITYIKLIIFYVIVLTLHINLRPFERYPGWDHFWVDVRTAGRLYSFKHALANFEFPSIDPYSSF